MLLLGVSVHEMKITQLFGFGSLVCKYHWNHLSKNRWHQQRFGLGSNKCSLQRFRVKISALVPSNQTPGHRWMSVFAQVGAFLIGLAVVLWKTVLFFKVQARVDQRCPWSAWESLKDRASYARPLKAMQILTQIIWIGCNLECT